MKKQKFQCKICGTIINGEHARRKHCQIHHPGTSFERLDVFSFEFKEIKADEPVKEVIHIPAPKMSVQKDKSGNVTYTTIRKTKPASTFDCSRAIPIDKATHPKSNKVEDLFEYAVKRVAEIHMGSPSLLDGKTLQEWANICFGRLNAKSYERSDYMALIKDTYRAYFKKTAGYKFRFDFEQIVRDFPHFFKGSESSPSKDNINIDGLISAVRTEISLSLQPKNRIKFKVKKIERIDSAKNLFQFYLDLGDDEIPSFYEGISIKFITEISTYECEGIDYDFDEDILTARCSRNIFGYKGLIYTDTTFILNAVIDNLQNIAENGWSPNQPGKKFIPNKTQSVLPIPCAPASYLPIVEQMDISQRRAHDAAVKNDICFIWGPPGTGKSFTLAGLINTFFRNNSSTLVCCISNVAVDQLINKVIDVIEKLGLTPNPGQILRSGHTIDSRLMDTPYLFPKDKETKRIREQIKDLSQRIASPSYSSEAKTKMKERRIDLRDALKNKTETLIERSTIVFSTIANYVLSKHLSEKKFDNLIVDEASMLSLPYLIAVAGKIAKRIILVGDPNQLGPIALTPDYRLRNSIFDYCNVFTSNGRHPALYQLLTQRRSHTAIVNLTNSSFYDGQLIPIIKDSPNWVHDGPIPGKIIRVFNDDINNSETKMIGSSRRNFGTCEKVMDLLDCYFHYWNNTKANISIGIITPYRAQVRLYYARIRSKYEHTEFIKNIKIGTIHTFQGSECDLVFFDLVEKSPTPVSRLMNGKDGERLITVALSRARHKMIIIGDTVRFGKTSGSQLVSNKVRHVIKHLRDF